MALNENYSQNRDSEKKVYSPNVYATAYNMSSVDNSVDPSKLSFAYWQSTLKISISPYIPNTEPYKFDYEKGISIFLNPVKAMILVDEINKFMSDPDKYNSCGVSAGKSFVTISNGKEFGSKHPCLIIRKLDDQGTVEMSYAYQFRDEFFFAIRGYDAENNKFDKVMYDTIEIRQLVVLLTEYYQAMSMATAFSVVEQAQYNNARVGSKLDAIASKLGVSFEKKASSNPRGASSYFNNAPASYSSSSLEEIDEDLN